MVRCCFCCYCCCCRRCWRIRGVYHVSSARSQSQSGATSATTPTSTRPGGGWTSRISGLLRSFHSQSTPEATQLSTFGTKPLAKGAKSSTVASSQDPKALPGFPPEAAAISSFTSPPPPIEISHASYATCAQEPATSHGETSWTPFPHCPHTGDAPWSKVPPCAVESDTFKLCKDCLQEDIFQKPSPLHCNHVHCSRHVHRSPILHDCALPHSCSSSCIEAHVCKHYQFHKCWESEGADFVHYRHHRRASHPVTFAETSEALFNCQHKITFVEKGFPPCDKANENKRDGKEADVTLGAEGAKNLDLPLGAHPDDTQSVPSPSDLPASELGVQSSSKSKSGERNVKIYQSFSRRWQKLFYRWSSPPEPSKESTKEEVQEVKTPSSKTSKQEAKAPSSKTSKQEAKASSSKTSKQEAKAPSSKSSKQEAKAPSSKASKEANLSSKISKPFVAVRSASKHSILSFLSSDRDIENKKDDKKGASSTDLDDNQESEGSISSVSEISSCNLSTGSSSNRREIRAFYESILSTSGSTFASDQELSADETDKETFKDSDISESGHTSVLSCPDLHPVSSPVDSATEERVDHTPSPSVGASVESYSDEVISTTEEEESVDSALDAKESSSEVSKLSLESDSVTEKVSEGKEKSYSISSIFNNIRRKNTEIEKSGDVEEKCASPDTTTCSSIDTDTKVDSAQHISDSNDSAKDQDVSQAKDEVAERRYSVASTTSEDRGTPRVNRIVNSTLGQWKRIQGSLGSLTTNIKHRYQQKVNRKRPSKEEEGVDIHGNLSAQKEDEFDLKEDGELSESAPEEKKAELSEGEEADRFWDESLGLPSPEISDRTEVTLSCAESSEKEVSLYDNGMPEDNQSIKDTSSSLISDVVSPLSVSECVGEVSSASNSSGTTSSEGGDTSIQSFLSVIERFKSDRREDTLTRSSSKSVEDEREEEKALRVEEPISGEIKTCVVTDYDSKMEHGLSDITITASEDKTSEVEKDIPEFPRKRDDRASRSLRWRKGSKKMPRVCRDSVDKDDEPLTKRPSLDVGTIEEEKDAGPPQSEVSASRSFQSSIDNTRRLFCEGMLESEEVTTVVANQEVSRDSVPCDNSTFKKETTVTSALQVNTSNTQEMTVDNTRVLDSRTSGGIRRREFIVSGMRDDTVDNVSDDIFDSDDVDIQMEDLTETEHYSSFSEGSDAFASSCDDYFDVNRKDSAKREKLDRQETVICRFRSEAMDRGTRNIDSINESQLEKLEESRNEGQQGAGKNFRELGENVQELEKDTQASAGRVDIQDIKVTQDFQVSKKKLQFNEKRMDDVSAEAEDLEILKKSGKDKQKFSEDAENFQVSKKKDQLIKKKKECLKEEEKVEIVEEIGKFVQELATEKKEQIPEKKDQLREKREKEFEEEGKELQIEEKFGEDIQDLGKDAHNFQSSEKKLQLNEKKEEDLKAKEVKLEIAEKLAKDVKDFGKDKQDLQVLVLECKDQVSEKRETDFEGTRETFDNKTLEKNTQNFQVFEKKDQLSEKMEKEIKLEGKTSEATVEEKELKVTDESGKIFHEFGKDTQNFQVYEKKDQQSEIVEESVKVERKEIAFDESEKVIHEFGKDTQDFQVSEKTYQQSEVMEVDVKVEEKEMAVGGSEKVIHEFGEDAQDFQVSEKTYQQSEAMKIDVKVEGKEIAVDEAKKVIHEFGKDTQDFQISDKTYQQSEMMEVDVKVEREKITDIEPEKVIHDFGEDTKDFQVPKKKAQSSEEKEECLKVQDEEMEVVNDIGKDIEKFEVFRETDKSSEKGKEEIKIEHKPEVNIQELERDAQDIKVLEKTDQSSVKRKDDLEMKQELSQEPTSAVEQAEKSEEVVGVDEGDFVSLVSPLQTEVSYSADEVVFLSNFQDETKERTDSTCQGIVSKVLIECDKVQEPEVTTLKHQASSLKEYQTSMDIDTKSNHSGSVGALSFNEGEEGGREEVEDETGLVSASSGGPKIVVTGAVAESADQPPMIVLESGSLGSGEGSLADGLIQSQDQAPQTQQSSSNLGSNLGAHPHRPPTPKSPITVDEWVAALPHPTSIEDEGENWSGCDQGAEDLAEDLLGLGDEAGLMIGAGRGSVSATSSACSRDSAARVSGADNTESNNISDSKDHVGELPLSSQHHGTGQQQSPSHGTRPLTLGDVEGSPSRPFTPLSPGGLESRRSQFASIKHSSFQSDLSGLSLHSRSSIDSLLDSRQADPVDVLLSLGFGGQSQEGIQRIPERFLRPSQVRGNNIDEFLKSEDEFSDMMESAEWMPGLDPQDADDVRIREKPPGMVVAGTALSPRGRRYRRHRLRPSSPQPSIRSAPATFQYPKSRYLSVHREGYVTPFVSHMHQQ